MGWLLDLQVTHPIPHALGIVALVCLAGMALGGIRISGIGLGTAGVLFAGIFIGHFGTPIDHQTLDLLRDAGLVLFVFTIGLQMGPGFFATLRQQGLKLNLLAAAIVLMGAFLATYTGRLLGFDAATIPGLFAGASINMPALGAVNEALRFIPGVSAERLALPSLAAAVTYPVAIVASIAVVLLLKVLFRMDLKREAAEHAAASGNSLPLEKRTLVVENLDGVRIRSLAAPSTGTVTISRVRQGEETRPATANTVLHSGDQITVVGTAASLDEFEQEVGRSSSEDLTLGGGPVISNRVIVTDHTAIGETISDLDLPKRFGVVVTRIARADIEMSPHPEFRLQFGDALQLVGQPVDIQAATAALGNSLKDLNETHFIPFFLGIFLGLVLGTMPVMLPGLPQPVRLGLAGGPLIVSLILGRLGHLGRLVCHMPLNANLAFREFGIALFFAAVGLTAGEQFFETVFSPRGPKWILAAICVTAIPLLITGIAAFLIFRMNFVTLSGLLAGSLTNPPALTFSTSLVGSDAPAMAYATVYPATMVMRIVIAQVLALVLVA